MQTPIVRVRQNCAEQLRSLDYHVGVDQCSVRHAFARQEIITAQGKLKNIDCVSGRAVDAAQQIGLAIHLENWK